LAWADGDWDAAEAGWQEWRAFHDRKGSRSAGADASLLLAELRCIREDLSGAEDLACESLSLVTGTDVVGELDARRFMVLLLVAAGRAGEAEEHLSRCREIVGGGEDWRGLAGRVALAEAAVAVAGGDLSAAEAFFAEAVETAGRYSAVWDEAEALQTWGRALLEAGERGRAVEKLDAAIAIYQRIGAGSRWLERVLAHKLRAQGVEPSAPAGTTTSIETVMEAVSLDQPDLSAHASSEGVVTLMFSDIEGSAALTERLGDQRWVEVLRAHNAIVREQIAAHGGVEVKSEGDGFMVSFADACCALRCAIAIQQAIAAHSAADPAAAVRVRIGLHCGKAVREADDFFGKNVVLAARIAGVARGGQILVSAALRDLAEPTGEFAFGPARSVRLKGLSGSHEVFAAESG